MKSLMFLTPLLLIFILFLPPDLVAEEKVSENITVQDAAVFESNVQIFELQQIEHQNVFIKTVYDNPLILKKDLSENRFIENQNHFGIEQLKYKSRVFKECLKVDLKDFQTKYRPVKEFITLERLYSGRVFRTCSFLSRC